MLLLVVPLLASHDGPAERREARVVDGSSVGESVLRLAEEHGADLGVLLPAVHLDHAETGAKARELPLQPTGVARRDPLVLGARLLVVVPVEERVRHGETGDPGVGAESVDPQVAQP